MELLPDEIKKNLPPLYASESEKDPVARVKFFTPNSNWTWYAVEFDGDDLLFSALQSVRGRVRLFQAF